MSHLPLNSARRPQRPCGFVDRPRKRPAHKLHKANSKHNQKRTYDVLQSADIFTRYGQGQDFRLWPRPPVRGNAARCLQWMEKRRTRWHSRP
jgi:hypothetical protein